MIPGNPFQPTDKPRPWIPINSSGVGKPEGQPDLIAAVLNHVIPARDLIHAVTKDRKPLCDAAEGALTIEMICGVFESHRRGGRAVPLPLAERGNALTKL